jgi:hypothetical protein
MYFAASTVAIIAAIALSGLHAVQEKVNISRKTTHISPFFGGLLRIQLTDNRKEKIRG